MSLIKVAAPWGAFISAGKTLGKTLIKNNVTRNALIGAGVGAAGGAIAAQDGNRLSGALKGGFAGGVLGGTATSGFNIYKNMNPGVGPKMTFSGALRNEGTSLANIAKQTSARFDKATDVLNRQKMKLGTEGRTKLKFADKFTSAAKGTPKPGEAGSAMHGDMYNGQE